MSSSRRLVRWALALLWAASGHTVAAAQPLSVSADVDPCVSVDVEAFRHLLDIELGTSVRVGTASRSAATWAATITVSCAADGSVELHLRDSVTRKVMTRGLPRDALSSPDAPRLLALAVAEFVVSSWLELSLQPPPVEPVGPPPPTTVRQVAKSAASERVEPGGLASASGPGPSLALSLSVTSWLAPRHALWMGPGLRLMGLLQAPFAWMVGGDFGVGSTRVAQGLVDHTAGSLIAVLGLAGQNDTWHGAAGVGGRVGYARLAGLPDRDSALDGVRDTVPVGGILLWTTASLVLADNLRVGFELELGYATLPVQVRAADEIAMELANAWLRGGVLLAVEL